MFTSNEHKTGKFLNFRKFDVFIGGLDISQRLPSDLTTTTSYYVDDITWCMRKAEPKSNILDLLGVMTPGSWLMAIITVITNSFVFFYFGRLEQSFKDWIYYLHTCYYLFLGAPGFYRPKTNKVRIVYGLHLIVGIAWNAIFCSLWISALSKGNGLNTGQMTSIEEAIDSGYQLAGVNITSLYKVTFIQKKNIRLPIEVASFSFAF